MELEDEVRILMRARRHVPYHEDDNFGINASDTLMSAWQNLTGTIFAVTIGVVAVFMVVGGIVIMNIMLATVTERTHEIGIRKSVGARRSDILWQFLIEAAVLAGLGGLMGVLFSYAIAQAGGHCFHRRSAHQRGDRGGYALDPGRALLRYLPCPEGGGA